MMSWLVFAAENGPPPDGTQQAPGLGGWQMILMMGVLFAVFYFLIIRPQRKREKERQAKREEMLSALSKNDHVVTIGGIHGVISSVSADEVTIKVDERSDVRMRFSRDAISRVEGMDDEAEEEEKK
jgi:preprotein translocase subunit YajC